jgi:hypothetical protein|nr:MAG TPA: hypothetical protein [Caudoviricetes sp.]
MSKFVNGELCEDRFGNPFVFLNYGIAAECIVYNPKTDIFQALDSRELRPVDRYYFHYHTIDVEQGINVIREAYEFKIFELHRKALPIAQRHLDFFKSLEGCTLDLSDSKLKVSCVIMNDKESHNWQDLIQIIGIRTGDSNKKIYQAPLSVLRLNSTLLEKMVEQLQED